MFGSECSPAQRTLGEGAQRRATGGRSIGARKRVFDTIPGGDVGAGGHVCSLSRHVLLVMTFAPSIEKGGGAVLTRLVPPPIFFSFP